MPSSLMIKLGALAVMLVVLFALFMDNRALRAEKATAKQANATMSQALKDTQEARDANASSYLTLQKDSRAQIDALNAALKDHDDKIQALQAAGVQTTIVYRTIKEKSDVATKAVLSTHLPEYQCLFSGSCEAVPAGNPGPDKVHPADTSRAVLDAASTTAARR